MQRLCRHVNILIISKGTKAKRKGVKRQTVVKWHVPAERIFLTRLPSTVGNRIHHSCAIHTQPTKAHAEMCSQGLIKILEQNGGLEKAGKQYIHIQELPLKGSKS